MSRSVREVVAEQIARWRAERSEPHVPPEERHIPVALTIAHAIGSNGSAIANRVGAALGVAVYDREIVRHIAATSGVRTETVELLDDRGRGLLEDFVASTWREGGFRQSEYLRHLVDAVLAVWQHGPCVMVGHGCVHIVPRDYALAVRLTAPAEVRVQRLRARDASSAGEAARVVRRTDDERSAFHRLHFGVEVDEPSHYDLVLDTSMFSIDACTTVLAEAYRVKFRNGRPVHSRH